MKHEQEFWIRVNELLDQREDPFQDPAVRAHLDEHPRDLDRLAALAAGLAMLEIGILGQEHGGREPLRVDTRPRLGRSPLFARSVPIAAALLLALLFALWPRAGREENTKPFSFPGRVLYYAITVATLGPMESTTRIQGPEPWQVTHSEKAAPSKVGSPATESGTVHQYVIQQRRYSP